MAAVILMVENYENHLGIFNPPTVNRYCHSLHASIVIPSQSHEVQLQHLKKDLANAGFHSPKSLQGNPSSVVCYCP